MDLFTMIEQAQDGEFYTATLEDKELNFKKQWVVFYSKEWGLSKALEVEFLGERGYYIGESVEQDLNTFLADYKRLEF